MSILPDPSQAQPDKAQEKIQGAFMMAEEKMVCYEWIFTNNPGMKNYMYCESEKECARQIERQYACLPKDYKILSRQIRIVKQKDNMKYYSELLYEEKINIQATQTRQFQAKRHKLNKYSRLAESRSNGLNLPLF